MSQWSQAFLSIIRDVTKEYSTPMVRKRKYQRYWDIFTRLNSVKFFCLASFFSRLLMHARTWPKLSLSTVGPIMKGFLVDQESLLFHRSNSAKWPQTQHSLLLWAMLFWNVTRCMPCRLGTVLVSCLLRASADKKSIGAKCKTLVWMQRLLNIPNQWLREVFECEDVPTEWPPSQLCPPPLLRPPAQGVRRSTGLQASLRVSRSKQNAQQLLCQKKGKRLFRRKIQMVHLACFMCRSADPTLKTRIKPAEGHDASYTSVWFLPHTYMGNQTWLPRHGQQRCCGMTKETGQDFNPDSAQLFTLLIKSVLSISLAW